jgi:uncharacterized protein (TIGR02186 family)
MSAAFAAALILLAAALFASARPALAQSESVELDTSTREISIQPDFNGAEVVIFGAVDNSQQPSSTSHFYDLIIVIRGPAETIVTRRKERVAGIWLNGHSRTFTKVPSFFAVLSTRPTAEIASRETLEHFDIEFDPAPLQEKRSPPDEFEQALVRVKEKEGMYVKAPDAVVFLSKSLFRATLKLPAQVLEGTYTAQVYLFREGRLVSWNNTLMEVRKTGIERYLFKLAYSQPWTYGMLAVAIAVACGFLGWSLFGRT